MLRAEDGSRSVAFEPLALCLIIPFLLAAAPSLSAQSSAPQPQDPLMSLMIAQPKIEIPSAIKATAGFDPPMVRPGQQAFLRFVINALETSIVWPTNIAGPAQLEIRPGAHEQILQMTGTNMEPRTAINCRVRASSPGSFTVPEFVVEVAGKPVTVPSTRLEVVDSPSAAAATRAAAHARTASHQPFRRPGRPGAHRSCPDHPQAWCRVLGSRN